MREASRALYVLAVGRAEWEVAEASSFLNLTEAEVAEAVQELLGLHLLRRDADGSDRLLVSPPDVAVATLLDDDARQL